MKNHIYLLIALFAGSLLLLTNCGKHETEGRTVGTLAGAAIGTAVAGRHSKGEGAALGALIGNFIGGECGKAQDDDEKEEKHNERVDKLRAENRNLKRQLTKYCGSCSRKVSIKGAQCCPHCGDHLIHEKFCKSCHTTFHPQSGYKYCPYCSVKVALRGR